MSVDFIDFTEIKGDVWYKANDVLLALGYSCGNNKNKTVQVIVNNRWNRSSSPLFNIQPRKFVDGVLYWNNISLAKVRNHLAETPNLKRKLKNWTYMEQILKQSLQSVISETPKKIVAEVKNGKVSVKTQVEPKKPSNAVKEALKQAESIERGVSTIHTTWEDIWEDIEKEHPQIARVINNMSFETKPKEIDYISIAKQTTNYKNFLKRLRKEGMRISSKIHSWKKFKETYPDIYSEIEDYLPVEVKKRIEFMENVSDVDSKSKETVSYTVCTCIKKGLFGINKEYSYYTFHDAQETLDFIVKNGDNIHKVLKDY